MLWTLGVVADGGCTVNDTSLWEYVVFAVIVFALPLALLACGLVASHGVPAPLRTAGLVLLVAGALLIVRQVLRTGVADLMPAFAIPVLAAAAVVYPLAAVALVRASSLRGRHLTSPGAVAILLGAAAAVQFAAPRLLTSGH